MNLTMNESWRPWVLDGGLATELEQRGHSLAGHLWSARLLRDDPQSIFDVHFDYLAAGADFITTCSYQASLGGFIRAGLSELEAEDCLRRSVFLAHEAIRQYRRTSTTAPRDCLVAASIGPYGASLADGSEYTGRYGLDRDGLMAFHRVRWELLSSEGPDLLLCETIPSLLEIEVLAKLADSTSKIPVWLSMQCRDRDHLADGTRLVECLAVLGNSAIAAIGVNCVRPSLAVQLMERLRAAFPGPLFAYPNAGEVWDATSRCWRQNGQENFLEAVDAILERNPIAVGGCCRTGPDDIRGIRRLVDTRFGNVEG
jgi:homocysteine S-methyltransferase